MEQVTERKTNKKEYFVSKYSELIERIHTLSPEYGKLTIDLFFHQGILSKAVITEKTDTVVFEKGGGK